MRRLAPGRGRGGGAMIPDPARLGGWAALPFFREALPQIAAALQAERRPVLPPWASVFRALELTPPEKVRVVILGQDPYPTPGHATGLAFSVAAGVALPASLRNVFRELEADTGGVPPDGDLSGWARQGVLLLNTVLTVPAGAANGHRALGWQRLAREVLAHLDDRPRAFLLWGRPAQDLGRTLTHPGHLRIESPHPSPLSAHRGFLGSRPFSRTDRWLAARGEAPVDWSAPGSGPDTASPRAFPP